MEKKQNFYMDTDSFLAYIKTEDIVKDVVKVVEARSDSSNVELERPLLKVKNKKVIELTKDE